MSHPWVHAESSVNIFGGKTEDYIQIHHWFDETKSWFPDWRHRSMRHHVEGIQECIEVFGKKIVNSDCVEISVYDIGIQHVTEDLGFVPTYQDWFDSFSEEKWKETVQDRMKERKKVQGNMTDALPPSAQEVINKLIGKGV